MTNMMSISFSMSFVVVEEVPFISISRYKMKAECLFSRSWVQDSSNDSIWSCLQYKYLLRFSFESMHSYYIPHLTFKGNTQNVPLFPSLITLPLHVYFFIVLQEKKKNCSNIILGRHLTLVYCLVILIQCLIVHTFYVVD